MPLASDTKVSFSVSRLNPYGRNMLARQLMQHDKLVAAAWMAPPVVEDKVLPIFMKQMESLHNAERFLPSYNQMQERAAQDLVMTKLLQDARPTSRHALDKRTVKFHQLRRKNPTHLPTFLERYEEAQTMEFRAEILNKSRKWVDDRLDPLIGTFKKRLQNSAFTRGGFPRQAHVPKKRKGKRRKRRATVLNPAEDSQRALTFPPPEYHRASSQIHTPQGMRGMRGRKAAEEH